MTVVTALELTASVWERKDNLDDGSHSSRTDCFCVGEKIKRRKVRPLEGWTSLFNALVSPEWSRTPQHAAVYARRNSTAITTGANN